ncbi:MAG: radical SAM protein, partial [Elusimicrobiota bacterium]
MNTKKNVKIALISLFGLDYGVRYISSLLKKNGYKTDIVFFNRQKMSVEFYGNDFFSPGLLDHEVCNKEDLDLLISLLGELKPEITGISVSSTTMKTAIRITQEIKKKLDTIVVWGGIHAIIAPRECIQFADIVCTGEGEYPMSELAGKIENREPITGIKSLWINNEEGIEKNEIRHLIENLDELPFPDFIEKENKYLIDGGKIGKDIHIVSAYELEKYPVMTSRGCMYSCAFCSNSVIRERYRDRGKYLRRRSVDNVIAELKAAVRKRSFHTVRFWDDIFTYDKEWIDKFCTEYSRHIGLPFCCFVHPTYKNRDLIVKLRQAGLAFVSIGIESGSEKVASKIFLRKQSNDNFIEFSHFIKEQDITMRYDLISDNPYETDNDQKTATELLLQLPRP